MTPLPNLDDRRWLDLVEEGKALIPALSPSWTDHNATDPGITLLELFAFVAEMDIYQLNRVPDSHRRKFLSLLSRRPEPPRSARALVEMQLGPGASAIALPAGVQFEADGPDAPLRFASLSALTISPAVLAAMQVSSGGKPSVVAAGPFAAFGEEPEPGAALYLGFDTGEGAAFPMPLLLWFELEGNHASSMERFRAIETRRLRGELCATLDRNPCGCLAEIEPDGMAGLGPPVSRLVWEYAQLTTSGVQWSSLEVQDETHGLTFSGAVAIVLPAGISKSPLGDMDAALRWVRVRLEGGCYHAPPRIVRVAVNAVEVEQAVPVAESWVIPAGTIPQGEAPAPGEDTGLLLAFNLRREITSLAFVPNAPHFRLLGYQAPTAQTAGRLTLQAAWLGASDGSPLQRCQTPESPVSERSFELWTLEEGEWRAWERRADFDSSNRRDRHYTLDAQTGEIRFGDGEDGVAPLEGALVFATFEFTAASAGNVQSESIVRLSASAANRVLLSDPQAVAANLASIRNSHPASGGANEETLQHALGMAVEDREAPHRAVTLEDFETLALSTPGVKIARATARDNFAPGFDCWKTPGFITVVVIPSSPGRRPRPCAATLAAVRSYLDRRRLIGSRVEVIGPDYFEVIVEVKVKALPGKSRGALANEVSNRLNRFFGPLTGGPEGSGWPLGRSVYPAEVLQVIDETSGVDYAFGLLLARGGCPASCGAIHLPPNGLPAAGMHRVEVV